MKVVLSREGFCSGRANHHKTTPTESQGLQGLSLVRQVGVTDIEVTHSAAQKHFSYYFDSVSGTSPLTPLHEHVTQVAIIVKYQ